MKKKSLDFYEVEDIYHFSIENQYEIKKFNKKEISDEELIYQSLNLMLIDVDAEEVSRILGKDAYNDYLKLNKSAKYSDIEKNLEVFDEVMCKHKNATAKEKFNFLERIIGRSEKFAIIPFVAAKLRQKYFSGKEAIEKMSFYRNSVYNFN